MKADRSHLLTGLEESTCMLAAWNKQTRALKAHTLALYYAYRHPGMPWYARLWVILVVAYAFSPIDLIPDFIPFLGYLDDLVLVPLGVAVAIRLIPPHIMTESRAKAAAHLDDDRPQFRIMTAVIILIWLVILAWLAWTAFHVLFDTSPATFNRIGEPRQSFSG
jgi:uncharacterized membrane protein YkvA (DUF1232 family)